jgi:hypothetical protein
MSTRSTSTLCVAVRSSAKIRAFSRPSSSTSQAPAIRPTAIYCANMVHIAPWSACLGLFRLADRVLPDDGLLLTYGPYSLHGQHTAESNAEFDQSLRERNPEWGVPR